MPVTIYPTFFNQKNCNNTSLYKPPVNSEKQLPFRNFTLFLYILFFKHDSFTPTLLSNTLYIKRLQKRPQFRQSLLCLRQISFPGTSFSCLQTSSSRWGPNMESTVGRETIESEFSSTCDTVHCPSGKVHFSFSYGADFFWFLIQECHVRFTIDSLFLSQDKILCAYQNTNALILSADFWVFGPFKQLSSAAVDSPDNLFQSGVY